VAGVVGSHQDVGRGGRVRLALITGEGGEGPVLRLGGTAAEGALGEEYVDAEVEREPVAQEEGAMEQQDSAGRELDVGTAGGPVGGRVQEVGQDPAVAAGFEGTEDLAPESAGVEPAVVIGLDVLVTVFEPERGGAQEALSADDQ
jgi:hypothetical protein